MTDETTAPSGSETIVNPLPADAPEEFVSAEDAAKYMMNLPADGADPATADKELPDEGNAAPAEKPATSENEEVDPAEQPPLELPRSWTKEQAEHWKALPRATQEYLTERASQDSAEVRRVQNEAAEKIKAIDAKVKEAEQVKQTYEAKLPAVMQTLLNQNNDQFGAIKSQADIDYLSSEAIRLSNAGNLIEAGQIQSYLTAWQLHQAKMAGVKAELDKAEGEKTQRHQSDWANLIQKENLLAIEKIPDLADKDKGPALHKRAAMRLSELGFSQEELNDVASGKSLLPIYDHRIQQLIFDSLKLADIQNAKVAALPKAVPPVQRPGTARPAGAQDSENIKALEAKLQQTGSEKDAWALLEAKSRASERRAS